MPYFFLEASFKYGFFAVLHWIVHSTLSAAIRWPYICIGRFCDYLSHKEDVQYVTQIAVSYRFTHIYGGKREGPALYIVECNAVKEK